MAKNATSIYFFLLFHCFRHTRSLWVSNTKVEQLIFPNLDLLQAQMESNRKLKLPWLHDS